MRKGSKHSAKSRSKISAALRGHHRRHSPETRTKISETLRGRKHSPERAANMRAALQGHKVSDETREKLSAAHRGRSLSPEHCAAIAEALRGGKHCGGPAIAAALRGRKRPLMLGNQYARNAPVKGECVYCFNPAATTYDHVIPRGRPGWDDPDNLVVCCLPCNVWKGQRTPEEWFVFPEKKNAAGERTSPAAKEARAVAAARTIR
jgi:HNH endonuclease/NUMOD3 motif